MTKDDTLQGGAIGVPQAYWERAQWIGRHVLPFEAELRQALRRRAPPGFEIDDIVQELYARLAALPSVDHIQRPKSYVFRMATGLVADWLRHHKVVPMLSVEDVDFVGGAADEPSPETVAADREELRRVMAILDTFPSGLAEVFRLRRFEHLSQREAAQRLGLPETTVEKRLGRCLLLLSRAIRGGGNEAAQTTLQASRKVKPRSA